MPIAYCMHCMFSSQCQTRMIMKIGQDSRFLVENHLESCTSRFSQIFSSKIGETDRKVSHFGRAARVVINFAHNFRERQNLSTTLRHQLLQLIPNKEQQQQHDARPTFLRPVWI